jgi:hypothetical protein
MIVRRRVIHVKQGCEEALVKLLKEEIERDDDEATFANSYRIYTPNISTFGVVVLEMEFENLQKMEALWDAWEASAAYSEFSDKVRELTELGGSGEVWKLVAHR